MSQDIIDRRDDQSGCANRADLAESYRQWRESEQTRDLAEIERRESNADYIISAFIGLILGYCFGLWMGVP